MSSTGNLEAKARILKRGGGLRLESLKFLVYIGMPIFATVVYADPTVMEKIINITNFVRYPPAGPKPPLGHDIEKTGEFKRIALEKEERDKVKRLEEKDKSRKELMAKIELAKSKINVGGGDKDANNTPKKGWW